MRQITHTIVAITLLSALPINASAQGVARDAPVTFAKDIAPILQAKCQTCHRPGEVAPMSLLTFADVRPWVRSIRAKVLAREMPPWYIDKTVGIQKFKNDPSLTDDELDRLVRWIDAGAPLGNEKDLPPQKQWPPTDRWLFSEKYGAPDLIVKSKPWTQPAAGQDQWWAPVVDAHLAEDRWVRAVEVRPSAKGRRVVHHAVVQASEFEKDPDLGEFAFAEFSIGSYGEAYDENQGKLLKAGTKFHFDIHYHSVGEAVTDQIEMGVYFYPKGYVPKYEVKHVPVGLTGIMGRNGTAGIDIPPNSIARHDAFMVLQKAARIENFKPHMHFRGKAMSLEAIYPDGHTEMLSYVDHYNFNWHISYVYADDVAPVLPKGTTLHVVSWHDNTAANKANPDPNQWVGNGSRSIDEMTHAHMNFVYLSDEDYARIIAERKRAKASGTQQQEQ